MFEKLGIDFSMGWTSTFTNAILTSTSAIFAFTSTKIDIC